MTRKLRGEAMSKPNPFLAGHPSFQGVGSAVITEVDPADLARVTVRLVGEERSPKAVARLALATPFTPAAGDRVVVAGSAEDLFVIGVLHAAGGQSARLADGATVRIAGDRVEIEDPTGHVVARYQDGAVHLDARRGDLVLGAPDGKVAIQAGRDIELTAGRDVTHTARRTLSLRGGAEDGPTVALGPKAAEIRAPRLDVTAHKASARIAEGTLVARRLHTTAVLLKQDVERLETTAHQILETTRDAFREVKDLAETRIGRARTLVTGLFSLRSKRTELTSEEDTSVDGRRVLLG